tara:strand:- start:2216 stop:2842 length:627 start_codon:yes stop_codon:yes gene_type:complete
MKTKIIDNFLKQEDLNEIQKIKLNEPGKDKIKVYHNKITNDHKVSSECMSEEFLIRLQKNYHDIAIDILKELCPEKEKLYDHSEFHIILTGKDYRFPIHDDTPNKLLSGVVYINPKNNSGTIFYDDQKGTNEKKIDWKQNRAVFFSRKERETWHSFQGDGKSTRIAMVYNLMTYNIKEVCKIEKKNSLFSNLRFKLNPYLYRYFKILI